MKTFVYGSALPTRTAPVVLHRTAAAFFCFQVYYIPILLRCQYVFLFRNGMEMSERVSHVSTLHFASQNLLLYKYQKSPVRELRVEALDCLTGIKKMPCAVRCAPQKVGSDGEPLWVRLQTNRWAECDFLRKRRHSGMSALWFCKKNRASNIKLALTWSG